MTTLALPPELCRHWEIIAEPDGPQALGTCQLCGMTKWYVTSYGYRYNNKKDD